MKAIPILSGAILLCAAHAAAQRPAPARDDAEAAWKLLLERHDADGDGVISKAEYGRGDRAFARLDRDRDGELTRADLEQGGRARRQRPADPLGMRAEILGPLARAADADEDDVLTREEWDRWLGHFTEKGHLDRQDLEMVGAARQRGQMLIRMLDVDRDRTLTVDEARAAFARLDADGDGALRGDELGPPLPAKPPKAGEPAPDFELPKLGDEESTVRLSSFAGEKPVALIFGSYT